MSIGVAGKLALAILLVGLLVAFGVSYHARRVHEAALFADFRDKGTAVALSIASSLTHNTREQLATAVRSVDSFVGTARGIPGVSYIYIQDWEGSILAHTFKPHFPPEFIETNRLEAGRRPRDGLVQIAAEVHISLPGGDIDAMDVAAPIDEGRLGVVHVGLDRRSVEKQARALMQELLARAGLLTLICVALGITFVNVGVARPLRQLSEVTRRIASEDGMTYDIAFSSSDEVGHLADSFRGLMLRLRELPASLQELVRQLDDVTTGVAGTASDLARAAASIRMRVQDASKAAASSQSEMASLTTETVRLKELAAETLGSVQSLEESNAAVAKAVLAVGKEIDDTADAAQSILERSGEAERDLESLGQAVRDTSASMQQVTSSCAAVERTRAETYGLAEAVTLKAQTGMQVVGSTLAGIEEIQRATARAASTMHRLDEQIIEVGSISSVIADITGQTNLLALNAAIIASQAGEHGRGFSVVADEVKALAARTAASAQQITEIVARIRTESEDARQTIDGGLAAVQSGASLAHETADALRDIVNAAQQTQLTVERISTATREQMSHAAQVDASMAKVLRTLDRLSSTLERQSVDSASIAGRTQSIRSLANAVETANRSQGDGSRSLAAAVRGIAAIMVGLTKAHERQSERSRDARSAVDSIAEVTLVLNASVQRLEQTVVALRDDAARLSSEVRRFQS